MGTLFLSRLAGYQKITYSWLYALGYDAYSPKLIEFLINVQGYLLEKKPESAASVIQAINQVIYICLM